MKNYYSLLGAYIRLLECTDPEIFTDDWSMQKILLRDIKDFAPSYYEEFKEFHFELAAKLNL